MGGTRQSPKNGDELTEKANESVPPTGLVHQPQPKSLQKSFGNEFLCRKRIGMLGRNNIGVWGHLTSGSACGSLNFTVQS